MKLAPLLNAHGLQRVRQLRFLLWLFVGVVTGAAWETPAQPRIGSEYHVKAAFLFNFAQFVEWPTNAFPEPQVPLVIGILGEDPFGTTLDEMVRNESLNNRALVVQRYRAVEEIKSCHILFICASERKQVPEILAQLRGRHLLTVGDTEGFVRAGGVIRFVTENNKIRFRVNLEAAKAANLTISSKLLKVAEIIAPGKD